MKSWEIIIQDSNMEVLKPDATHSKQWNQIDTFTGLHTIDTLRILDVRGTKLNSFYGAEPQPSLQKFRSQQTPLGENKNIALMALIVFGDNLTHVNGEEVGYQTKDLALTYRNDLLPLLTKDRYVITSVNPVKLIHTATRKIKKIFIERPTVSTKKDNNKNSINDNNEEINGNNSPQNPNSITNKSVAATSPDRTDAKSTSMKSTRSNTKSNLDAKSYSILFNDYENYDELDLQQDEIEIRAKKYFHNLLSIQVETRQKARERLSTPFLKTGSPGAQSDVSSMAGKDVNIYQESLLERKGRIPVNREIYAQSVTSPNQNQGDDEADQNNNSSKRKKPIQEIKIRKFKPRAEREFDYNENMDIKSILSRTDKSGKSQDLSENSEDGKYPGRGQQQPLDEDSSEEEKEQEDDGGDKSYEYYSSEYSKSGKGKTKSPSVSKKTESVHSSAKHGRNRNDSQQKKPQPEIEEIKETEAGRRNINSKLKTKNEINSKNNLEYEYYSEASSAAKPVASPTHANNIPDYDDYYTSEEPKVPPKQQPQLKDNANYDDYYTSEEPKVPPKQQPQLKDNANYDDYYTSEEPKVPPKQQPQLKDKANYDYYYSESSATPPQKKTPLPDKKESPKPNNTKKPSFDDDEYSEYE